MQNGVFLPLLFKLRYLQSLEQLLLSLEISLEGVAQKGLAEPPRPCKEHIPVFAHKVKHHVGLVHIHLPVLAYVCELVGIYRI